MSRSIALSGAGEKMAVRLSSNLVGSAYQIRHVEVGEAGRKRLIAHHLIALEPTTQQLRFPVGNGARTQP